MSQMAPYEPPLRIEYGVHLNCTEPNVEGVPLWMQKKPVAPEMQSVIQGIYDTGRSRHYLEHYAKAVIDVVPAAHHRLICQAIDDLLDDQWDVLVINTPPGAAKSTYTSHALAAFYLGGRPKNNVILATHTADLSERWSRRVRNSLDTPAHQLLFPESQLSKDSTAVGRWATTQGGELLAAGVGGSILGFRADLAIIDDPISGFEQAQNESQLKKIHDWYENDLITRLKPGAKQVLICQRLSANDLAGYLLERNRDNPAVRQLTLILPMESKGEGDALNRPAGERLWPEWYTEEMVEDAKRDDFRWRTLYQQEPPSDTGSWVSTDEIQHRPTPINSYALPCYGMSDIALSVNKGDYTVHMIVAVNELDEWDILWADRARVDPDVSSGTLVELARVYKPLEWLIDDDNASKVFMQLVATKARMKGVAVPWKPMPMRGQDKETRASALRGQFKRRRVYYPADAPFAGWLTRELLTFPNAMGDGVDDGVDALSLMGRRMATLTRHHDTPPPPPKPTIAEMTLDGLWEANKQRRYGALRI